MSSISSTDGPRTADEVMAIIKSMIIDERKTLFRALEYQFNLLDETGFVVLPRKVFDFMSDVALSDKQRICEITTLLYSLDRDLAKMKRSSAPETIRRNVEICDLRNTDKKKWSHQMLARKFGMRRQSVATILKKEKKWRKLMALPPE